jgi:hypothetical protein
VVASADEAAGTATFAAAAGADDEDAAVELGCVQGVVLRTWPRRLVKVFVTFERTEELVAEAVGHV